jgi:hypothetical protein
VPSWVPTVTLGDLNCTGVGVRVRVAEITGLAPSRFGTAVGESFVATRTWCDVGHMALLACLTGAALGLCAAVALCANDTGVLEVEDALGPSMS